VIYDPGIFIAISRVYRPSLMKASAASRRLH